MTALIAGFTVIFFLFAVAHLGYMAGRHDMLEDILREPEKYGFRKSSE
jgi:hypothetical protein